MIDLRSGDCRAVMASMGENSVDSVVTDPPYHLGFMGKVWDGGDVAFDPATWAAALRVLKPGGHLVAFGAPKNYHRLACAIEDAGFEVRDSLMWVTGQGFPKSHNVTKNLDDIRCRCCDGTETLSECDLRRMRGADVPASEHTATERAEVLFEGVSEHGLQGNRPEEGVSDDVWPGQPGVEGRGDLPEAPRQLRERPLRSVPAGVPADGEDGRVCDGTPPGDGEVGGPSAPAARMRSPQEPPATGKRPREPRTVAGQSEPQVSGAWPLCGGCGKPIIPDGLGTALKPAYEPIILARKPLIGTVAENVLAHGTGALNIDACRVEGADVSGPRFRHGGGVVGAGTSYELPDSKHPLPPGRWPANLVHDGSDEVLAAFPDAPGQIADASSSSDTRKTQHVYGAMKRGSQEASAERTYVDEGGTNFAMKLGARRNDSGSAARFFYCAKASKADRAGSKHPTVKPIALMRWLCRLITPPGGSILDPFAGTGTTGAAALAEGFTCILIEREAEYQADIKRRMRLCDSEGT